MAVIVAVRAILNVTVIATLILTLTLITLSSWVYLVSQIRRSVTNNYNRV